jgi:archaeal flagellin FlaB
MLAKNIGQHRVKGITGLETAIILIAFVIVASVLSYVVISAGLFSSQKAKSAVNAGLDQTGATIEMKGNVTAVLATQTSGPDVLSQVNFVVGLVPGGRAIDLVDASPATGGIVTPTSTVPANRLTISFSDSKIQIPSLYWEKQFINVNNGDNMLDAGELAIVIVYLDPALYTTAYPSFIGVPAGDTFSLNITPPDGAVLPVERQVPSGAKVKLGDTTAMLNLY